MRFRSDGQFGSKLLFVLGAILLITSPSNAQQSGPSGIWSSHVKGIGGVFVKVEDPNATNQWYQQHFGMDVADYGYTFFLWRDFSDKDSIQRTVWSTFPMSSEHFGDTDQMVMINYIIDDLDAFLAKLREEEVEQIGETEEYDHGRFAWIKDLNGNKLELWEPPSNSN